MITEMTRIANLTRIAATTTVSEIEDIRVTLQIRLSRCVFF